MPTYRNYWKVQDQDWRKFGALRARNLAEELVAGWTDQTNLSGFDLRITCHAAELYGEMIREGRAESNSDEVVRDLLALYCDRIEYEGGELVGEDNPGKVYSLCWAETMLASRALKALSGWLQEQTDEPPEPAIAA